MEFIPKQLEIDEIYALETLPLKKLFEKLCNIELVALFDFSDYMNLSQHSFLKRKDFYRHGNCLIYFCDHKKITGTNKIIACEKAVTRVNELGNQDYRVIIISNDFSEQAINLAKRTGIYVFSRGHLVSMLVGIEKFPVAMTPCEVMGQNILTFKQDLREVCEMVKALKR